MPWARLMRGSRSKLKTVALLAGQRRAARPPTAPAWKKLRTTAPWGTRGHSLRARRVDPDDQAGAGHGGRGIGRHRGPGLAVGLVGEGGLVHRPRTAPPTSQPAPTSFLTTSGTRATRRSPGRVSVGTANFTARV